MPFSVKILRFFGILLLSPVSYTHLDVYKRQHIPQAQQQPAGHVKAAVDVKGMVHERVVDEALPAHGGAGLVKYTRMMITRSFSKRAICSFRREA